MTVPCLVRPDPRVSQRIYTSLDTFRSRRMDHTVFHKWLIKQTTDMSKTPSVIKEWEFVSKRTEISLGNFVLEHFTTVTLDIQRT